MESYDEDLLGQDLLSVRSEQFSPSSGHSFANESSDIDDAVLEDLSNMQYSPPDGKNESTRSSELI
jgi:hypothetical protein